MICISHINMDFSGLKHKKITLYLLLFPCQRSDNEDFTVIDGCNKCHYSAQCHILFNTKFSSIQRRDNLYHMKISFRMRFQSAFLNAVSRESFPVVLKNLTM